MGGSAGYIPPSEPGAPGSRKEVGTRKPHPCPSRRRAAEPSGKCSSKANGAPGNVVLRGHSRGPAVSASAPWAKGVRVWGAGTGRRGCGLAVASASDRGRGDPGADRLGAKPACARTGSRSRVRGRRERTALPRRRRFRSRSGGAVGEGRGAAEGRGRGGRGAAGQRGGGREGGRRWGNAWGTGVWRGGCERQ